MIIKNDPLLLDMRTTAISCEHCGQHSLDLAVHHIQKRSQGRIDAYVNLIVLGGSFACGHHQQADDKKIDPDDLWRLVAIREKMTFEAVKAEISRINRLDKNAPRCGVCSGKGKYSGYPLSKRAVETDEGIEMYCPECERMKTV